MPMIALLSPAKTLDFDAPAPPAQTEPRLLEQSAYLIGKLQKLSAGQVGKLMSINPELAALNHDRFARWQHPYPAGASKAAMLAFRGEVYRGLDADSLSTDDLAFAQDHVRILSGLYGLLRPMDAMLPYRLEMGTRLKVTPKKTNLYKYWDATLRELLEADADGAPLVNLASNEYYKALQPIALTNRVITCHFRQLKNGEYKPLMTYAKHARGLMARFMVQHRITDPEDLKAFNLKQYTFNPRLSDQNDWVFTRDVVEL